jgi:hypothetical protein
MVALDDPENAQLAAMLLALVSEPENEVNRLNLTSGEEDFPVFKSPPFFGYRPDG